MIGHHDPCKAVSRALGDFDFKDQEAEEPKAASFQVYSVGNPTRMRHPILNCVLMDGNGYL